MNFVCLYFFAVGRLCVRFRLALDCIFARLLSLWLYLLLFLSVFIRTRYASSFWSTQRECAIHECNRYSPQKINQTRVQNTHCESRCRQSPQTVLQCELFNLIYFVCFSAARISRRSSYQQIRSIHFERNRKKRKHKLFSGVLSFRTRTNDFSLNYWARKSARRQCW